MASPESVTLKNLNGKFVMNKKLSDDFEPLLALVRLSFNMSPSNTHTLQQGIGWVTRKALGLATVTLRVKQYADDKGVVHIDIDQTATGGIKGTTELRQLDWQEGAHEDQIFGKVRGRTRWIKLSEVQDEYLKKGWNKETEEDDVIENYIESVGSGWTAHGVWGFEQLEGKRYHVRHVIIKKKGEAKRAKLVYDYQI